MAVKVLITRYFKEDKINEAHELLRQLRSRATMQPGYISGQTLISTEKPNKLVVVSTWAGPNAWKRWESHLERSSFIDRMSEYLERPEQKEVFHAGVPTEDL